MKKWLPYLVAAVIGLGVAVLAFGPGMGDTGDREHSAKPAKATAKAKKKIVDMGDAGTAIGRDEGDTKTPAEVVRDALADPPPPPGTLRPQNPAELEHAAKLERPLNKHSAYVSAFWNQAARLVGPSDADLGRECSAMTRYLRDQGNLADADLDVKVTVAKEQELVARLRPTAAGNAELTDILDYIEASSNVALQGGDPTAVPKPQNKAMVPR